MLVWVTAINLGLLQGKRLNYQVPIINRLDQYYLPY